MNIFAFFLLWSLTISEDAKQANKANKNACKPNPGDPNGKNNGMKKTRKTKTKTQAINNPFLMNFTLY
ncbi:hypothetical protein NUG10_002563 [Yersinia enterocolitica]|nr:hypothetical protein [Yersinia enterocolitica]EKN3872894.1 hypothetical protein [Yersinia enterocolitica]